VNRVHLLVSLLMVGAVVILVVAVSALTVLVVTLGGSP
jgi:hypothetical protein